MDGCHAVQGQAEGRNGAQAQEIQLPRDELVRV